MKSPEATSAFVHDLIVWIYDRPEMYGRTVGEVDTLLYYLHCVWAEITEKTGQFNDIRANEMEKVSEHPALGFTTDAERVQLIPEGGKVSRSPELSTTGRRWTLACSTIKILLRSAWSPDLNYQVLAGEITGRVLCRH